MRRDRHSPVKVTNEELFFDLIYAFAVTQLSHRLLEHLDLMNALQTLVLWFAVWLGWQYTCWVTNWFNPETGHMRFMLFGVMLLGLLMSSAIPEAFAEAGLMFALCYVAIQVGRTVFVLLQLRRGDALRPNFRASSAGCAFPGCCGSPAGWRPATCDWRAGPPRWPANTFRR